MMAIPTFDKYVALLASIVKVRFASVVTIYILLSFQAEIGNKF